MVTMMMIYDDDDDDDNGETIDRLITAYPILAKQQYVKRHHRVCAQLHFKTCKEINRYRALV